MKTNLSAQGCIDGVWNHSFPRTLERHRRLMMAASACQIHFAISYYNYDLCCIWPGNEWVHRGARRTLGELPRERIITELRALRHAARDSGDPLTLRTRKLNRLRMEIIPPAFQSRPLRDGIGPVNPSGTVRT